MLRFDFIFVVKTLIIFYGSEQHNDVSQEDENGYPQAHIAHFMPFEKEDIAVFEWVSNQIGIQIHDYNV